MSTPSKGLHDVLNWNDDVFCAATAICAVTGASPDKALEALQLANNEIEKLGAGIAPRDWTVALETLGVTCMVLQDYRAAPYAERPNIHELLADWGFPTPVLVLAYPEDEGSTGHVFATCQGLIVDTYTCGRVVSFTDTPASMRRLRVKYVMNLEHRS